MQLAQSATSPTSGFDYAYPLPSDNLRVLHVYDSDADAGVHPYEVKANQILFNSTACWLVYIKRVTDPNDMDPLFREALSYRLAQFLAVKIAGNRGMAQEMMVGYKSALRSARSVDALEDWPEQFPVSSWLSVRN